MLIIKFIITFIITTEVNMSNLYRVEGRFSIEDGEVLLSSRNCTIREINDNDFSKSDVMDFLESTIINDFRHEDGDRNIRFSAEILESNGNFTLSNIHYM